MVKLWFLPIWVAAAVAIVVLALRMRRTSGTYWWEPPSKPAYYFLGAAIVAGCIVLARWQESLEMLFIGLAVATCGPAVLVGLWYRVELRAKGLKPKYLE